MYSAHRGTTTQWHTGHYPSTTDTTGPQGGSATGEGTAQRRLVDPEPDHAPSQHTDYSARPTDRTASTTPPRRTPSLHRTECSTKSTDYSHILRRDTNDLNSRSDRSRGRAPGAHTLSPTHTVYSAQLKNPDPPMQRPEGTPTTAPGGATQPGPTGGGQPEGEQHSDDWGIRNQTTPHRNAPTTAAETHTKPQAPHHAGVPRALTARSIAPNTRTTATLLDTRHNTTTTGTMSWGQNHKQGPLNMEAMRPRTQDDHRNKKHCYPCPVEHPAARWKPSLNSYPAEATNPPPEPLPSGLDIPETHELMDLDKDPLQDSIQRIPQAATGAH